MVLTELQKYEIIYKHFTEKISIRNIAKEMKINKNTVSLWILKYKNNDTLKRKKEP